MQHQQDVIAVPRAEKAPDVWQIFLLFARIGLTSFGGGTSGWLFRELAQKKRWIGEEEFLDIQALCQAMPGVNITNMAVWLGRRFCGMRGAAVALLGIVVLPSILIVLIAMFFAMIAGFSWTETALVGATAAAIGLPASMALTMAARLKKRVMPWAVFSVTFFLIGVAKAPLIWVALGCGGTSVAIAFLQRGEASK